MMYCNRYVDTQIITKGTPLARTGWSETTVPVIEVRWKQNRIKPEKLYYKDIINTSWEETKEKYLGEIGR